MSDSTAQQLDLAAVRARLDGARGRDYWRSLDELAAHAGVPGTAGARIPAAGHRLERGRRPVEGRRNFLKLMGASLALAGLDRLHAPADRAHHAVRAAAGRIDPRQAAVLRHRHDAERRRHRRAGREPRGPPHQDRRQPRASRQPGRLRRVSQASVCGFTIRTARRRVTLNDEIRSWGVSQHVRDALAQQKAKNGAGLRILTETITSPTLAAQFEGDSEALSAGEVASVGAGGTAQRACRRVLAFGQPVNTYYDFAKANVVVSLDSDFLNSGPASLRYARQFARRRRVRGDQTTMNRLYVVEPMPTPTGAKADHRLPLRAGDVEEFAWTLAIARQRRTGRRGRESRHQQVGRAGRARPAGQQAAPAS